MLKTAQEFLPTLSILFHPQSIIHALSSINVTSTVNLNETALGSSAVQIRIPNSF